MRITMARSYIFVVVVAILAVLFSYTAAKKQMAGARLKASAAATVLEVRPYTRSRTPRLWVKFEFVTKAGDGVRSARAVNAPKWDAVEPGDQITVRYNPKRPKRNWIAALEPPSQVPATTRLKPAGSRGDSVWTLVFGAIILLAGYAILTRVLLPIVRSMISKNPELAGALEEAGYGKAAPAGPWARTRGRRKDAKRVAAGSPPPRRQPHSTAGRMGPGKTKMDRWGRAPVKHGVKVRGGWL